MTKKGLLEHRNRLHGKIGFYVMPSSRSFEIDSLQDFYLAKQFMKGKGKGEVKIGERLVGGAYPSFFIAEIGINHNGSLEYAKQMIDMAAMLGADAVKFQKRVPELCVPEAQKEELRETPWGEMTYLEYKKRMEFGQREYEEIDRYCKDKGIMWFASPWDTESVDFLEQFDVPCYKVASAKITDKKLLEKIKQTGKPIIISTGMSTMEQIERAVSFLGEKNVILMHCNSSYPAADKELNLNVIQTLSNEFSCPIGYSGHELGISASIIAACLGASVIERHITLDRTMWGTDQAASLEYGGLRRLIRDLRKIPAWKGDGVKKVYASEEKVMKKLRDCDTL